MKLLTSYKDIPIIVKDKLKDANPFFLESVGEYYLGKGKSVVYLYDEKFIMPVVISKRLFFKYGYLPTEPFGYSESMSDSQVFINSMAVFLQEILCLDWVGQTSPSALFQYAPKGSTNIPFGSHVIDLRMSEEELWSNIHSKHRNVIRNAMKHNVVIKIGGEELLDDYMIAEKQTQARSNLPGGNKGLYVDTFREFNNHILVFMAYFRNDIQGGAIIPYSKAMGYYEFGATVDSPLTGAMNLTQWEIIKHLKRLGVNKYSFVGARINEDPDSKYHGIQTFKKRFGGELVKGKMFKMIFNPYKYAMYKKIINIKTKGLGEDIIDQEIHKWK